MDNAEADICPTPDVSFFPQNIPDALKQRPWWAPYKLIWNEKRGKFDKVPYRLKQPDIRGSTADQAHWGAFDDAVRAASENGYQGVGLCLTWAKGICGAYDLDDCLHPDGRPFDWAKAIMRDVPGYWELSPSKLGLRAMFLGGLPGDWTNHDTGIEAYGGGAARFVTLTGDVWPGREDIQTIKPEVHDDIRARFGKTTVEATATMTEMPELLEGVEIPPGVDSRVREFLETGDIGDYTDKSRLLSYCANALIAAGLDKQQTLSLLFENEYSFEIALDHRKQNEEKALAYLWKHQVDRAKAEGPIYFEDFEEKKRPLPLLIQKAIKRLAKLCNSEVLDFCTAIKFSTGDMDRIISGAAFNQANSKYVVLTPGGDFRVFTEKKLIQGLRESRGSFYSKTKLEGLLAKVASALRDEKAADKLIKENMGQIDQAVIDYLTIERQFGAIALKVDMFAKESSLSLFDGVATLTLPHLPFDEERIDEEVIDDFKDHWPMFDDFLGLLAASRFASARKKAYLWLHAESDWGKGFLEGVLSELGMVVSMSETEVDKLFSGGPVGRQMNEFKRAWVLLFNEFKSNRREIKMLEQALGFAPKNLPICKVELFLKLFLSAETVESLASTATGVEDQFANRFSMIQPAGNIDARPLFAASRKRYLAGVSAYVARELNRMVAEYVALGREGAADKGDQIVIAFHREHGIANKFTRLSTKLKELCQQHLDWLESEYRSGKQKVADFDHRLLSPSEKMVLDAAEVKDTKEGKDIVKSELYVKTPARLLTHWLEVSFNQAERGKLTFKSDAFKAGLPRVGSVRFESGNKDVRYVCNLVGKPVEQLEGEVDDDDFI